MRKKLPQKQSNNKSSDGFIRIISGQFRGRKLPVKNVEGLRPTTDRIKETLFNWLMQDTRDAKVLDCFAGSGGLGFEALSRFAHSATFLEMDNSAAAQLKTNAQTLNLSNTDIHCIDSLQYLGQNTNEQQFDLVFVDPPFRLGLAQPCCDLLIKNNWLSENALVYIEIESELNNLPIPNNWLLLKEKIAGQVQCRLYQVQ
ncbi:16S rRNA (guanine(966)-N(2))-methyltransferase RsmD [Pseudoalteromonas sp. KS88]|uniref:16S rRNA (guanine(966)-N(2))-methyltransferase RsmD n=1 Tax=Pseudoalteromonas sp. KS88 TaxID=2109918 RepID=UPI001081D7F8|nr:16S rRNA (guanine(966)-N(2))-methyltransferase RsmD [Pseudoalteromonas sp. KS88]TGE84475.1 16S rRNA (guanine(966)-N(2))-methyltransferase RsmD [Pseudoalteromonas sp. KS88]